MSDKPKHEPEVEEANAAQHERWDRLCDMLWPVIRAWQAVGYSDYDIALALRSCSQIIIHKMAEAEAAAEAKDVS